jgi:hypothetical protein
MRKKRVSNQKINNNDITEARNIHSSYLLKAVLKGTAESHSHFVQLSCYMKAKAEVVTQSDMDKWKVQIW